MAETQNNNKNSHKTNVINDQSKKVLGGILQNAEMARHSTCTVVKYAKDDKFVDTLNSQIDKYDEYIKKAKELAKNIVDIVKAVKEKYMEEHECVVNNEVKEKMDEILTDIIWESLIGDFYG